MITKTIEEPEPKRARNEVQSEQKAAEDEDKGFHTEIEAKVDCILEKLCLNPPNLHEGESDRIKAKLDFIIGNLVISKTVSKLEQVVEDVKKLSLSKEKLENGSNLTEEVKKVIGTCRSVAEIETKVPEFQYDENLEKVVCQVCKSEFKYDVSQEQGRKQSNSLGELKYRLKSHLEAVKHKTKLGDREAQEKIDWKEENRNKKCGMNLSRTCYHILYNGRPTSDFTELLSIQHSNGADIGDLNHSFNFVTGIASAFSGVITGRVKKHLSTRLPQTGCLPPCKVVEDGATYRHDTRLLIGVTTVFPGDKPLLQSKFLGAPKGIKGDAVSIAQCIADTISNFIKPEQYLGTSEDGANFLAHVGEQLDKLLGQEGHHDWDGPHAAATVDTGLRNPKKEWAKMFAWLNEFTAIISKANKFINWGMEWARFFKVNIDILMIKHCIFVFL